MKCSQCYSEAVDGYKMCSKCAALARERNKRYRNSGTAEVKLKKKERSRRYAERLKSVGGCLQCGKDNDNSPHVICTACTRKVALTAEARKRDNPEKEISARKERNRRYYENNTEKVIIGSRISRHRRRGAAGNLTSVEWKDLLNRYGNKCLWCGKDDVKLTIDHVVPVVKGGTNYPENIQPLCKSCNSKKGAKILDFRPFGSSIMDWT